MKVGFIGSGKMAEAMIASLVSSRLLGAHEIFASDISAERRRLLKSRYGVNMYSKNNVVPGAAEIIFLAVKPQQLDAVLKELAPNVISRHLVISIAAGKKISLMQARLPHARVIRVMPNLASLVSEGMSVFCAGKTVTASDKRTVTKLLSSFGKVLELSETRFDAVTALSGSGPAFFTYFLEKMADAAVKEGLSEKDALLLAEQTMLGTSRLLIERKTDPGDLISAATSAKGTTAAGMEVLRKSTISKIVRQTIRAAAKRSKELSVNK